MAETAHIVNTLKGILKKNGLTYLHVSEKLNLSEASIKKMLSTNRLSLDRLDKVCELLNMEISDLIMESMKKQQSVRNLTYTDELEIVSDLKLLLVATSVLNGISFEDIIAKYKISAEVCKNCLIRLEKIKLIRLLSGNNYKLNVRKNFSWLHDGPIQNYFHDHLKQDFFDSKFDQENDNLVLATGILSENARKVVVNKLEKLAIEFGQLEDEDKSMPFKRKNGCTMVLAFRKWQPEAFQSMMRYK